MIDTDCIWQKGRIVEGLDPDIFRKDCCGALIMYERYNQQNPFGWVVNLIYPKEKGGDEKPENLRPMHYQNAISKADDYPSYVAVIRYNGKENTECKQVCVVNEKTKEILKNVYNR